MLDFTSAIETKPNTGADTMLIVLRQGALIEVAGGRAQRLAADGQLTAWLYSVGRAPDGTTRLAATGRVAILRSDALRIEAYRAALPVANPPATP